jgi:vancomycin resistance protein VanJ
MNLTRLYLFVTRFSQRLIIAATQIFVLGVLSWHILRFYPGDRWYLVRLGSYFAPWLMMALVPFLSVALLGRRLKLATLALVAMLLFIGRYAYLFLPRPAIADNSAASLKIMTFNVNYNNRKAQEISELIRKENPDVIAFQELTKKLAVPLEAELGTDYPYSLSGDIIVTRGGGSAVAIASRYPLTKAVKSLESQRVVQAIVQTPEGAINLWNIHPVVAVSSERWQIQRDIIEVVAGEVARSEGPVIVVGDFNTTDQAENYALLGDQLKDSYQVAGRGFGFTFPVLSSRPSRDQSWRTQLLYLLAPVVRIDHILVSSHFSVQEIHIIPDNLGSDHRPVVATLQLKP